jgi:hemolysin activation/secretion protein
VAYISGKFKKGVEIGQDEKYDFLRMDYNLLTFLRLPYFRSNTRIIYRASLQYAGTSLSSINQFLLAGPTRARAYPVNQFSADNAFYTGVDWMFDAPAFFDMPVGGSNVRHIVHPFVFLDAAWGETLSLVEGQDDLTAQLFNAGFGFQFTYLSKLHGNLQFAFPVSEDFSSTDINTLDESFRLVFDFQYIFR